MSPVSTDPTLRHDEAVAIRFAERQGMTLVELSHLLLVDLCRGLPAEHADLALRIFHATLRLQGIPH